MLCQFELFVAVTSALVTSSPSPLWSLLTEGCCSLTTSSVGLQPQHTLVYIWVSLVAQTVKNLPAIQETQVRSLGWEDPLEMGTATHSSILARRSPWTEEPGGLQSLGSQRVGHDWMCWTWLNTLQFSSVLLLSCVRFFATPWTAAHQTSLCITNSQSLLKLMTIQSVMPSIHLILCHTLLLPPSIFPSMRVFSDESVLCIRWPKYWSFSFSVSPSNVYSGLISFRMDWFDLFAVQWTLRSLNVQYIRDHLPGNIFPVISPRILSTSKCLYKHSLLENPVGKMPCSCNLYS